MKKILALFILSIAISNFVFPQNVYGPDTAYYKRGVSKQGSYSAQSSGLSYNSNLLNIGNNGTTKYRVYYQWNIPDNIIPDNSTIDSIRVFFIYEHNISNYYMAVKYYNVGADLYSVNYDTLWNRLTWMSYIGTGQGNKYGSTGTASDTVISVFNSSSAFVSSFRNSLTTDKFILGIKSASEAASYAWLIRNSTVTLKVYFTPPQQSVTVDQKLTTNASYGYVGKWGTSSFTSYAVPYTFSFPVNSTQYFRADTNVVTSGVTQKFNNWNGNSTNSVNHKDFIIYSSTNTITSNLDTIFSPTIKNEIEGFDNINDGTILLRDPWFRDSSDSKGKLNRGTNAIFRSRTSPYSPSTTSIYKGMFLNQQVIGGQPYYFVQAPTTINLGGSIGTRTAYLLNWSATPSNSASFQNSASSSTGVVFKTTSAVVSANLKIQGLADNTNAISNPNQRKYINFDGTLYQVYESMNRVWLEKSDDDGTSWSIVNSSALDEGPEAKNPSIDFVLGSSPAILITYQVKTTSGGYNIKLKKLNSSEQVVYNETVYTSSNSYSSYDATPVVCGSYGWERKVVLAWKEATYGSIPAGIYFRGCVDNGSSVTWSSTAEKVSTSDASSVYPAMNVLKGEYSSGNYPLFHLAWQQNITGGSKVKYTQLYYYQSSIGYNLNEEPSSGSAYPNNLYPSIIVLSDGTPRLVWIGEDPEMATSRTLLRARQTDNTWYSTIYEFGAAANNSMISLNMTDNGYVIGWTESNGSYNKYIRNTSFSSIKNFGITGKNVQVCNSDTWSSWASMFGLTLSVSSTPYNFNKSNSVSSIGKENGNTSLASSRKAVIYNDSASIYFALGDIKADGKTVDFTEIKEDTKIKDWNEFESYLTTEPFTLNNNSELDFSVMYVSSDSVKAKKWFGEDKESEFKVELVNDLDGSVIGAYNSTMLNQNNIFKNRTSSYNVKTEGIGEKTVRLRLSLENSLKGNFVLLQHYNDDNTLPKSSSEEISYKGNAIVKKYGLSQNYPNPFNPATVINYQLPKAGNVTLKVYDALGKLVRTLVDEYKTEGKYSVEFTAGNNLSSGMYFYELRCGDFVSAKKMLLVK